ncbi:MAG: hypothetical protein KDA96_21965, partial [Planctomycetaceae bacterium]|nr:hypothetical protein [Planctomycetaceae bacterium]
WNSAVAGDFLRLSHTACAEPQCGDACADPCGEVCANACGESCDLGLGSLLGDGCGSGITSLLHKSDHCFDEFISPITNPIFFEDPRTLTEARLIYVNHSLPAALGSSYHTNLRSAEGAEIG